MAPNLTKWLHLTKSGSFLNMRWRYPQSKNMYSNVQRHLPVFQCVSITSVLSLVPLARAWLHPLCILPHINEAPMRLLQAAETHLSQSVLTGNIFVTICWTSMHPSLSCTRESKTGHSFPGVTSPGLNKGEGSSSLTCWQHSNTPKQPQIPFPLFFVMQLFWLMFNLVSSGIPNSKSRLQI